VQLVGQLLHAILWGFIALLWVRFIFDWVQLFARTWAPSGPVLILLEVVYSVTDPPIKALRHLIPPLRLGSVALDLSFLVVLIAAYVLLGVVDAAFGV
jgi:YggT family protein